MFIAHLPAGYLLSRDLERRLGPGLLAAGLLGSIFPDLDLLRFYLLDERRTPHHAYWTHWPLAWLLLGALTLGACAVAASRRGAALTVTFVASVLLHLALDTVPSSIRWLAPLSMQGFNLVSVPPGRGWWVANFVLHWTFCLELGICLWAMVVWEGERRAARVAVLIERCR